MGILFCECDGEMVFSFQTVPLGVHYISYTSGARQTTRVVTCTQGGRGRAEARWRLLCVP